MLWIPARRPRSRGKFPPEASLLAEFARAPPATGVARPGRGPAEDKTTLSTQLASVFVFQYFFELLIHLAQILIPLNRQLLYFLCLALFSAEGDIDQSNVCFLDQLVELAPDPPETVDRDPPDQVLGIFRSGADLRLVNVDQRLLVRNFVSNLLAARGHLFAQHPPGLRDALLQFRGLRANPVGSFNQCRRLARKPGLGLRQQRLLSLHQFPIAVANLASSRDRRVRQTFGIGQALP